MEGKAFNHAWQQYGDPSRRRQGATREETAHRVAWALRHDQQIPVGMTVDHWCHNRVCCNPAHLRLLSNVENARDNTFGDRTHCPRGHEYDEANTYIGPTGGRRCRTCARTVHRRQAA